MKVYQIWKEQDYWSGGFHEVDRSPYDSIKFYKTREEAEKHMPNTTFDDYGGMCEFYVKEVELEIV